MPVQGHTYHWKHGWIPLDHVAALSKAKGSHNSAEKIMAKHGIQQVEGRAGGGSKYSDMTISELIRRRDSGDRGAEAALKRGEYKKVTAAPASAPKSVSDRPGAPGVMNTAAYQDYSAKVSARRQELQSKANALVETLPEAQARDLLTKYEGIRRRLSIGFGESESRPYPSAQEIEELARANASVRALRDRVAYFDSTRAAAHGKLPATDAQIEHIKRLLARRKKTGEGGGFMTVRGDLGKLTKAEASAYIDSLSGQY